MVIVVLILCLTASCSTKPPEINAREVNVRKGYVKVEIPKQKTIVEMWRERDWKEFVNQYVGITIAVYLGGMLTLATAKILNMKFCCCRT